MAPPVGGRRGETVVTISLKGRRHEVTGQRGRFYDTRCGLAVFHTDNNNTYVYEIGPTTCQACLRARKAQTA